MGTAASAAPRRRAVRARYGRISAAVSSAGITTVALLGATGVLPGAADEPTVPARVSTATANDNQPATETSALRLTGESATTSAPVAPEVLPAASGSGRRVVFDLSAQRVWLVGRSGEVERTYLASGSLTDNLTPGTYEVYSTSRHAVGVDDSGTMQYMVRFSRGRRAPIGFHDIPVKDGRLVQTREDLGTPRSHGCIRQWRPDARALWRFAGVGTNVVVTA